MNGESKNSGWGIGIGIGLSALIGLLISAIVGMLRIASKHPDDTGRLPQQPTGAVSPPPVQGNASPAPKMAAEEDATSASPLATDAVATASEAKTTWKPETKYFVSGIFVLVLIWLLYISRSSISTIIFAILLTFITHPVSLFFQRKLKMRYGTATAMTYLLTLLLIILLPFLAIPSIVEAFSFIGQVDFTEAIANVSNWLTQQAAAVANIPIIGSSLSAGLEELAKMLNGTSTQAAKAIPIDYTQIGGRIAKTVQVLVSLFGPLLSLATSVVFALLISLHINLSVDMINNGVRSLIPEAYKDEIMSLLYRLVNIWKSFLRGQVTLMVVVGTMVWLGNVILGTPQALFLGFLAGLLEVIPNLGPVLATIPAIILALLFGSQTSFLGLNHLDNWVFALIVIGFYILVQVTENQLLVPYILGDAVNLPPMVVLSGVFIAGSAFGIVGVFLATPMISSGVEIFNYLYDKILETPPEPPPPEDKPSLMDTIRGYAKKVHIPRFLGGGRHHGEDKPESSGKDQASSEHHVGEADAQPAQAA